MLYDSTTNAYEYSDLSLEEIEAEAEAAAQESEDMGAIEFAAAIREAEALRLRRHVSDLIKLTCPIACSLQSIDRNVMRSTLCEQPGSVVAVMVLGELFRLLDSQLIK